MAELTGADLVSYRAGSDDNVVAAAQAIVRGYCL